MPSANARKTKGPLVQSTQSMWVVKLDTQETSQPLLLQLVPPGL